MRVVSLRQMAWLIAKMKRKSVVAFCGGLRAQAFLKSSTFRWVWYIDHPEDGSSAQRINSIQAELAATNNSRFSQSLSRRAKWYDAVATPQNTLFQPRHAWLLRWCLMISRWLRPSVIIDFHFALAKGVIGDWLIRRGRGTKCCKKCRHFYGTPFRSPISFICFFAREKAIGNSYISLMSRILDDADRISDKTFYKLLELHPSMRVCRFCRFHDVHYCRVFW